MRTWNDRSDTDFAPLQFLDLHCHPLQERGDLVAGRFTDVDGQSLASIVRKSKVTEIHDDKNSSELSWSNERAGVAHLFHGDTFGQIPGLVNIAAAQNRNMISQ